MQATQDILTRLRTPSMQEYFRTRGFSHVSLFGSYARGTPSKESDLDLLVERSERGFTIFDLFSFERELAKKLGVKEVQITIKPKHRQERFVLFEKYIHDDLITILD